MTEENLPNLQLLETMAKEYATCCERGDTDNAKGLYYSFLGIIKKDLEKFRNWMRPLMDPDAISSEITIQMPRVDLPAKK